MDEKDYRKEAYELYNNCSNCKGQLKLTRKLSERQEFVCATCHTRFVLSLRNNLVYEAGCANSVTSMWEGEFKNGKGYKRFHCDR